MSEPTIEESLAHHTPQWMKLDGIVGTGIGLTEGGEPCLRVFLSAPNPALEASIPDEVDGHPVEVVVTGTIRPRAARGVRDARGFTLIELLFVTLIIGILAMIMALSITTFRDRAMVATTRADVREALNGIELYRVTAFTLPSDLNELVQSGFFTSSNNVRYCTFEMATNDEGIDVIRIEAHHVGSSTLLSAEYSPEGRTMEESPWDGAECSPAPQRLTTQQGTD